MHLDAGWWLLVGGTFGAVRNAIAKKFYQSDFANRVDTVVTDEMRATEVRISVYQRILIIGGCIALAIVGTILIQRHHNWNPFQDQTNHVAPRNI